ncbi:HaeIII family restriction endonuclease [Candidatus Saccharibacteria bacterium]|nr:HaeIII family restriction endonuclease [Candidatus Saccharibacteria bacterium]
MSNKSNDQGHAYEYICLLILEEVISERRPAKIIENSSLVAAKRAWDKIGPELQENLKESANAAVRTLCTLELRMLEDGNDMLELLIQPDNKGEDGDVRDILVIRRDIRWEIGLSLKHNHFAVKHSRLSKDLDFGEKWFGIECSQKYWEEVGPIFDYLDEEIAKGTLWREIPDKKDNIYVPLLKAFMSEIKRSYSADKTMAKRLGEYLLGKYDFYKVISIDRKRETQVQPLNVRGTLNKPTNVQKSIISVPLTSLPERIIDIEMKPNSKTTVELYMDNGWQFSFRIHSADEEVETSLKFDVQAVGIPATVISINTSWDEDESEA